jgi:hypothetical protein
MLDVGPAFGCPAGLGYGSDDFGQPGIPGNRVPLASDHSGLPRSARRTALQMWLTPANHNYQAARLAPGHEQLVYEHVRAGKAQHHAVGGKLQAPGSIDAHLGRGVQHYAPGALPVSRRVLASQADVH